MPATPDMAFFDKYKSEEAESSSDQPDTKRRMVEEPEEQEEYEPYQDQDADLEDEEGRFFGGGLTAEQSNILDLVDEYDAEEVNISFRVDCFNRKH